MKKNYRERYPSHKLNYQLNSRFQCDDQNTKAISNIKGLLNKTPTEILRIDYTKSDSASKEFFACIFVKHDHAKQAFSMLKKALPPAACTLSYNNTSKNRYSINIKIRDNSIQPLGLLYFHLQALSQKIKRQSSTTQIINAQMATSSATATSSSPATASTSSIVQPEQTCIPKHEDDEENSSNEKDSSDITQAIPTSTSTALTSPRTTIDTDQSPNTNNHQCIFHLSL